MRRHLQVFFNVNLKIDGFSGFSARLLQAGNFFLAPTRSFFNGKAVRMGMQGAAVGKNKIEWRLIPRSFAKVASFFSGAADEQKQSKQEAVLFSTNYGRGFSAAAYWTIQGLAVIPGIILGSLFKGFAYLTSPKIRAAHQITKDKLTPQQLYITTGHIINTELENRIASGQATSDLVIDAQSRNKHLSSERLSLVKDVNATKTVFSGGTWDLAEDVQTEFRAQEESSRKVFTPPKKRKKWDLSALVALAALPVDTANESLSPPEDTAGPESPTGASAQATARPRTMVDTHDKALAFPGPTLFSRDIKKHTIIMRVDTAEEKATKKQALRS